MFPLRAPLRREPPAADLGRIIRSQHEFTIKFPQMLAQQTFRDLLAKLVWGHVAKLTQKGVAALLFVFFLEFVIVAVTRAAVILLAVLGAGIRCRIIVAIALGSLIIAVLIVVVVPVATA